MHARALLFAGVFFVSTVRGAIITPATAKPNIVFILADDYGWHDIGYHRNSSSNNTQPEIVTPNLDALAAEGVKLERHYAYKICSPSRCSLQSGRLPVHVNTANTEPESRNANDTESGYAGIPRSMTGIAERLARDAGYATAMSGKWDAGMATPDHTPRGRGYGRYLGYYHHANDYWTEGLPFEATGVINVCLNQYKDLWLSNATYHGPAARYVGHNVYEEEFFTNHSLAAIDAHGAMVRANATSAPLFLVHAFHLLHTPLQIPQAYLDKFAFIDNGVRQHYASMVYYMDEVVGKLVAALKANGLWANSLLVFASDNGGPIYNPAGANNWPLKARHDSAEDFFRLNALLSQRWTEISFPRIALPFT